MSNHTCDLCQQPMRTDDALCLTCRDEIWRAKCDTDQEAS